MCFCNKSLTQNNFFDWSRRTTQTIYTISEILWKCSPLQKTLNKIFRRGFQYYRYCRYLKNCHYVKSFSKVCQNSIATLTPKRDRLEPMDVNSCNYLELKRSQSMLYFTICRLSDKFLDLQIVSILLHTT